MRLVASPQRVARALALAVATVSLASLASGQITINGGNGRVAPAPVAPVVPATGPAPVAGQPGVAPRPPAVGEDGAPANPLDRAADSGAQVYVDDSFSAVDKLRDAENKAHQGQYEVAIKKYQEIINSYGQKLVYLNNDSYVSITDFVREKLLEMPAVKDGAYDQLFGAEAKTAIDKAIAQRDLTNLIRTCDLYFPATASMDGLSQAAEWYFERAEFAAAAKTYLLLLNHPMVDHGVVRRPLYLFRALVAQSLAGNKAQAQQLRDRLATQYPHAIGPVNGVDVDLLQAADSVLSLPALASQQLEADEWPGFEGAPSHTVLLNVNSSIEARLWSIPLDDESLTGTKKIAGAAPSANNENGQVFDRFGRPIQLNDPTFQPLNSYPVLSQGTIFVHNGERVTALSVNAGTPLWAYPAMVSIHINPNPNGFPTRITDHDSVSVADDQVFAILPTSASAGGTDRQGRMRNMGNQGTQNTRLVCLNRQTGAENWSCASSSISAKFEKPGLLAFMGSPIVTRQGVYVMGRKIGDGGFTEIYLVRLDRETGNPSWYCYLCSTTGAGAFYGMPSMNSNVPIPTLIDDVVYIATGQGADCAVDANAGRILWLSINDTAKTVHNPNEMYNPNYQNMAPSWKFNPPLVYGDKLVTCDTTEPSAAIRIYNRANGKLIRSLSKNDLHMSSIDVLAGMVGSSVVVIGDRVTAFDINSVENGAGFQTLWNSTFLSGETGRLRGRPFLAANCLYAPYEKGLIKLDPANGQSTFAAWPNTEKDVNGKPVPAKPGNLLVTSEQVVVLNDAEIAGYSKWETARDNRLAKIKEHPGDADSYLALAEISFRTGHYPLAQENMKRAVELAVAPESAAPAGFIDRLYRTNLNFAQQLLLNTETEARDRARFYFEQCKVAARDPEQNAEWRLTLSELSLAQSNLEEAASLYNQVLNDPALRNANYHRGEVSSRGAVAAESLFHALISQKNGPEVYKRYEDQAVALLNRARPAKDSAGLEQIVESYPNSNAAIAAATDLADAARDAHDPAAELKPLHWLSSRVTGEKKASVLADTALAYAAIPKHYFAALAFADRGLLLFKDYSWKNAAGQTMTFAGLKDQIRASRSETLVDGRNPILPSPVLHTTSSGEKILSPDMDENSIKDPILSGTLLTPIEPGAIYRRSDLLFAFHNGAIHIFDTTKNAELTTPQGKAANGPVVEGGIQLQENAPMQLLGCVGDTAILVQSTAAIAVNLKDMKIAWTCPFIAGESAASPAPRRGPRAANMAVVVNGGFVQQEFQQQGQNPNVFLAADPEVARQIAFGQLTAAGKPLAFSTLRIINNHLVAVVGDKLSAIDIASGQPAWKNAAGKALDVTIAGGAPGTVIGNEDVLVAQVDDPNEGKTLFRVFDADSGKFRKQIELFQEHPLWRSVSDDGTLFLVTDKSILAYDLFNDRDAQPLWKRQDIRTPYPAATALTPDGLIVIVSAGSSLNLQCLSPEGGETRWPAQGAAPVPLHFIANGQKPPFIRSVVDGGTVIYQSPQHIAAYFTYPAAPGDYQIAWDTSLIQPLPPIQLIQMSEPYVVALASGPADNTQRAVRLFFLNLKGGKISLNKPLRRSATDPEGPLIKNWQLADHGMALEVNGDLYFFHATMNPQH